MDMNFQSDGQFFLFCFMFSIAAGYRTSLYYSIIGIGIQILFAKHYKIKELARVCIIRMITLGLLLAAPASLLFGKPYFRFIQIPIYLLIAIGLDYFLSRLILKSYPKKIVVKYVILSDFAIIIPFLLFLLFLPLLL